MNKKRRNDLKQSVELLNSVIRIIDNALDEETESYENMPEGLQSSEKGEQMEDNMAALDNASEMLEEAKGLIEDAIVEIENL